MNNEALKVLREKKHHLEKDLAISSDSAQKFTLRKQIEECAEHIAKFTTQSNSSANLDSSPAKRPEAMSPGIRPEATSLPELFIRAFNFTKTKAKEPASGFSRIDNEHSFFAQVVQKYGEHAKERYGKIKILNMERPIELGKHYTRVNILAKIIARSKDKIEWLEAQRREHGHFGTVVKSRPGIEIIIEKDSKNSKYSNIIVLGKPGAGKTTFLRYIMLEALKGATGQLKRVVLPILVELRDLAQSTQSLLEFIYEQFDICEIPNAKGLISHLLNAGDCLILLDGLDEVATGTVAKVVKEVKDLADKYNKNQFILSCRIAAYNYNFEQFIDVEIADFDEGQVQNFVLAWFGVDQVKSQSFLTEFKKNRGIKELTSRPLLLALLCIDYDERMRFPANRGQLYRQCIETLLEKWDGKRGIKREDMPGNKIYKELSKEKKELMFAGIAADMMAEEKAFLPELILREKIGDFIKNLPNIKPAEIDIDSKSIIKAIESQHGIFVERAEEIYSFSHLTFQEYFAAKDVIDNREHGSLQTLVEQHLLDSRWREVILITMGNIGKADSFLIIIKRKIDSLVDSKLAYLLGQILKNDKLLEMLPSVELVKLSSEQVKTARLFAFLLFAIARASDLAVDCALALALDLALDLALALARALAPALNLAHILALDLALALARALVSDLNISWLSNVVNAYEKIRANKQKEIVMADLEKSLKQGALEIERLNQYLYGVQLLVEGINSDCYMSKEVREEIMNGLFNVPG